MAMTMSTTASAACGKPQGFLGQIWGVIDTTQIEGKTEIYLRFNGSLKDMNDVLSTGKNVTVSPGQAHKEPVYASLQEAMSNLEADTEYVLMINLKPGLTYGQASKAYNRQGKQLKGYAIDRCMSSPLGFEEN